VGGRGGLVTAVKTKLDCESSGRILVSTVSETEEETKGAAIDLCRRDTSETEGRRWEGETDVYVAIFENLIVDFLYYHII
jgi:hypothetical protein